MSKFFIVLVLLCISLGYPTLFGQENQQYNQEINYDYQRIDGLDLDKETIEEYKNDPDYNYLEEEPEDTWWSKFRRKLSEIWQSFIRWLTGGNPATGFWLSALVVLKYLFIAGLIALLIWVFLKIDNGRNIILKNKSRVFITDEEEIINNEDIQQLIDQALAAKNYRLAIRYYYLLTLQKLSGKELIDWQVQKTNHEYIYEIKEGRLRKEFSRVTDIYDYIWYGNFEVNEGAFAKAQQAFQKLNSEI